MEPYEYKSAGDKLKIRSGNNGLAIVGIDEDTVGQSDIIVHSEALPEITGKLFEACGLPAPAIIPASGARFDEDGRFRFGDFGFKLYPEGVAPSLPGVEAKAVPPAALRELAAHLVALADHAEAEPEPDPAEVEALAVALHSRDSGSYGCGCGAAPERPERHAEDARTALRWMSARKATSDA